MSATSERVVDAEFLSEADLRRARNQGLEDAARVAELVNMPPGRGPVLLFEVRAEIANAIRRLKR